MISTQVARDLAEAAGASVRTVEGDALLEGYPQIHAVGRAAGPKQQPRLIQCGNQPVRQAGLEVLFTIVAASTQCESAWRPRTRRLSLLTRTFDFRTGLIDLTWGSEDAPKVTLVGKGVCFDTGGLDIKPAAAMLTMKKDMGGAAHVLGLAAMVMDAQLPVRLRVLVPAVENAISGDAFRPGDVLVARNGKTTEIGNTDAEGRLVLADALVEACSEAPDLLVDCATLTGAGRVALGTDVPCLFANDEGVAVADVLVAESAKEQDQVWRLPLWQGYREEINGKVADLKNIGNGPYGGAITAALYLAEFVEPAAEGGAAPPWLHLDMMAFNTGSKPGRPEGGEAMGMRALFRLLEARFGK